MADDATGDVLTYNGTSWVTANIADGSNAIEGVSCPSSSFCAAVDAKGNVLVYTGTSWASAKSIDGTKVVSSVSCPSASFCVAVDTSGNADQGIGRYGDLAAHLEYERHPRGGALGRH